MKGRKSSRKMECKNLHLATECGDFAMLKRLLVQRDMDVNATDAQGRYAIHLALKSKNAKVIEALLATDGIDVNVEEKSTLFNVLHYAALTEDGKLFHQLVSMPSISVVASPNRDRNTPLHFFCGKFNENYEDTFEIMLKKGAKVNCQNYSGETPLHNASWKGHNVMCDLLLQNNADPNLQNDHGETPLHWVARAGYEKVIRMLLKGGANPKTEGVSGTPYVVAVPIDKVKYLLREGKLDPQTTPRNKELRNLSLTDKRKISPFHWEIDYSEIKIFKEIGRGGFGVVYKGEWRGIEVAVKQISKDKMSPELFEQFLQEISIMSRLHHPNILLLCGACIDSKICYITEFMSQGSLRDVLSKKKNWNGKPNYLLLWRQPER